MKKNVASQRIGCQMIAAADGSAFAGTVTVYVTGDAGTQAIGSVSSGVCTHEGNGYHTYAPAQAETNYDLCAFTFIGTGAIPTTIQVYTNFPQTGDNFARIGAPVGASISADVAAVKTQTAAIEVDTQDIQARIPAALVSGRIDASVGAMAANTLTASALASDAVTEIQSGLATPTNITAGTITTVTNLTNAPTSGDFTATMKTSIGTAVAASAVASVTGSVGGNVTGSVGSVVGLTVSNLDATISSRASAANLATVAGYLDTEVAAIQTVTNKLDTAMELDGAVYRFTTNALEQAPTGGSAPTAAEIADAVWDEDITDHLTGGSTGAALNAAGSAGDPWTTPLPGAYSSGTAGYIVGTNLDAPVSTAGGGLDAAGVRAAVGLASANLDTQLDALPTAAENTTAVWAAGARTLTAIDEDSTTLDLDAAIRGALGMAAADLDTQIDTLATATALATAVGYIDTEVAAIKAKTDNLPADPADASDIAAAIAGLDIPTVDEIWDEAVDGTVTARQSMRLQNSALAGKASGLETTSVAFRDLADTKDRITATVTADGNRTAVTTDLT